MATSNSEREQNVAERLARLEVRMDIADRERQTIRETNVKIADNLALLVKKVERYESKLGGVFLLATAIIAFLKLIGEKGWSWLSSIFQ